MYIRQLQATMNKWTSFSFFYYYLYMTFYYVGYNYNHELNKLQLEMIVENAEHHSYLWTRDTRMRQNGRHTRVQCDLTRRRARYASACASNRVQFFFFFFSFPDSRQRSPNRADSRQIRSYRPNIGVFWPEKGNWLARKKKT